MLDEPPLVLLPSLSRAIGVDQAVVLQQLHFHLVNPKCGRVIDGRRWIYNSYDEWQAHDFRFWSTRTLRRTFTALEKLGLVMSRQPETRADGSSNRRKYYRIDYEQFNKMVAAFPSQPANLAASEPANLAASRTKTSTKTTKNDISAKPLGNSTNGAAESNGAEVSLSLALWVVEEKKKHAKAQDHPKWHEFADWCDSVGGKPCDKGFWTWLANQKKPWRSKVKTRKDDLKQMPPWKLQRLRDDYVGELNRLYRPVKDIEHLHLIFPKEKREDIKRRYKAYAPRRDKLRGLIREIDEVIETKEQTKVRP